MGEATNPTEGMRDVIAESFEDRRMVGAFIVVAEVTNIEGEVALLSWWDGGSDWSSLGMAEWFAERMRQRVVEPPGEDVDDG